MQPGPADALPAWVTTVLAIAVILGAFGTAVGMLVRGDFSRLERFRLTLAMLCFALSSLSGLLFANQSATELIGKWGAVTLTLVGPAALWLVALIVITRLWKDVGQAPEGGPVTPAERGLVAYGEWKFKHAGLNYLFTNYVNEEYRVREILSFAYFRAVQKRKPIDVKVATVFVYFQIPEQPEAVRFIKLQRITGVAKTPPTDVYHIFTPTLPGGTANSYAFVRAEGKILGSARGGPGSRRWLRVDSLAIDVLVVSSYPDGNPPEGDYVWIDVPKYSDTSVDVGLAFLARRPIADEGDRSSKMWAVHAARSAAGAPGTDVPVMFKSCAKGHVAKEHDGTVLRPFAQWLADLDALLVSGSQPPDMASLEGESATANDPVGFLRGMLGELRTCTERKEVGFAAALGPEAFPHVCTFDEMDVEQPVIATFQWN